MCPKSSQHQAIFAHVAKLNCSLISTFRSMNKLWLKMRLMAEVRANIVQRTQRAKRQKLPRPQTETKTSRSPQSSISKELSQPRASSTLRTSTNTYLSPTSILWQAKRSVNTGATTFLPLSYQTWLRLISAMASFSAQTLIVAQKSASSLSMVKSVRRATLW